jgi:hypothetical protein
MPVFTDLDDRVGNLPFDAAAYRRRLPRCREVASRVPLLHACGRGRPFEVILDDAPHEIVTSENHPNPDADTRSAEARLRLPPSAYFYAGRAHPFGSVALAFDPTCEQTHTGSATPFDTGGLLHAVRKIGVRLSPTDGEAERVEYGRSSEIALDRWRDVFARVLASHFASELDYWVGKPLPFDPEGLYELNSNWRAWTFEVRFYEGQSLFDRAAWCADEAMMELLRRRLDSQEPTPPGDPPTPLEKFLQGPTALEPAGTPDFCGRLERWVREQCSI